MYRERVRGRSRRERIIAASFAGAFSLTLVVSEERAFAQTTTTTTTTTEHEVIDTSTLTTLPTAENAAQKRSVEDAPPPPPYKKGVVIETSLGVLDFLGQFRKVAPPAPWLHLHAGYEIFQWLMVFGEAELFFTDTSNAQNPPKTHTFPAFGFGGGVRGTYRVTPRVGIFLEGNVGVLEADIAKGALTNIGYKNAESFNPYIGGHVGAEWYQLDRHLGLAVLIGMRDLTGFKKQIGPSDTPLALDGGLALRYTF